MAKVFVSYRRADNAAGYAMDLARILRERFGDRHVFRDMRSIPPGVDFGDHIRDALQTCAVMLVVIGRHWATERTDDGRLRLFEPDDWVRLEVATALAAKHVRVIPVLVGGGTLPRADQLPADLQPLASRNAVSLEDGKWENDVAALVRHLEEVPGLTSWWETLLGRRPGQKPQNSRIRRVAYYAVGAFFVFVGIGVILESFVEDDAEVAEPPIARELSDRRSPETVRPGLATIEPPAAKAPAAAPRVDISGMWMDGEGNRYRLLQEADAFTVQQLTGEAAMIGQGNGFIDGRTITFDFYIAGMHASSGFLILSPDGRTMQGSVQDSVFGLSQPLYMQRQ